MSFQQAAWIGGTFGRIELVGTTSRDARGWDGRQGLIGTGALTREASAKMDEASAKRKGVYDPLPGRRRGEVFDPGCPGLIVKRVGKQRAHLPGVLPQDD